MASLYDLSAGYASLVDAYDMAETEEEREEILGLIADAEGSISEKAESYAKLIRIKQEEAKAFKAEADRLSEKKQAAEHMVDRLKRAMLDGMVLCGASEIATGIGKWRVQKNPWSCEVVDVDRVPQEFHIKQEDKIDKKGLLAKFKADGEIIDGVEFKQELGVRFR